MAPQTINLPYIEAGEVFGPSFGQPQTIDLPYITAGVVFPPSLVRAADAATQVELRVGGSVITGTFEQEFSDPLADAGTFSFQMLRDDFLSSSIAFDDEVVFKLDGTIRFRGIVEDLEFTTLAQGGKSVQGVVVSGRGILAQLDDAVVQPSRGPGSLPIEDVRSFSWVSTDYSATGSGWPLAKVVNYARYYAGTGIPRPHVFPNPISGKWIWGNVAGVTALDAPQGINLFRQVLTLGSTQTIRFFFAGDNVMRLWIDAAEITWFAGSSLPRYVDIELGAGGHVIAAKVANKTDVPGEDNPAGFILAGYSLTSDGLLDDLVIETDANWRVLPYPVRAPGFTVGKLLRLLFVEAGLDATWTLDFSDTVDSDGQPWTYQREVALNKGRSLLEVVRELMDVHADIAVAFGSKKLRAWNRGSRGRVRSVTLQQTGNRNTSDFLSLSHKGRRTRMNKALIRYADGDTTAEDAASVGTYGLREKYLEVGHITDEDVAIEYAEALMENRSVPSFSTTARLLPRSSASTPYEAFGVGDWITCPDENGDDTSMRVGSIAWSRADEDAVAEWTVTLRDKQYEAAERQQVALQRMAMGYAVGGARVSSRAGTPAPSAQQVSVLNVVRFSYDNTQITTGLWPKDPATVSGNIVQLTGELTTPGSTTTTIDVYKNATLLGTLTFLAGETETTEAVDAVPVHANSDKFQTDCTAAGTDAAGLVVQVLAI